MIFISHRGNVNEINIHLENTQNYIDKAIELGYEVEIDLWKIDEDLFLGHDRPERLVKLDWLEERKQKLWIHTKNRNAFESFTLLNSNFKFFWHTLEPYVFTSNGVIWAHDYKNIQNEHLCIVPLLSLEEVNGAKIRNWYGVCTDYPDQCREKWGVR